MPSSDHETYVMQPVKSKLLAIAEETLERFETDRQRANIPKWGTIESYLRLDILLSISFIALLLAYYSYTLRTSFLVQATLLCALLVWNIFIGLRESKLTRREVISRIQSHINYLAEHGIADKQDLITSTNIPTISVTRVLQNGQVKYIPTNLLVKDDIILLSYGDRAPCQVECIPFPLTLERSQLFKPSRRQGTDVNSSSQGENAASTERNPNLNGESSGLVKFRCCETPLIHRLESALSFSRPEPVLACQLNLFDKLIVNKVMIIAVLLSFLVNLLRFFLIPWLRSTTASSIFVLGLLPLYAVFPLAPFMILPTILLIARSYGNARILSLFDALQSSKAAFEDEDDVDEFDAVPAPTKDVTVDSYVVWKRFLDQLVKEDLNFLARTTGLIESLANVSVVCAIDREGTIARPYPSVEQLFLFGEGGEPIVLDVSEDLSRPGMVRFEDKGWRDFLPVLKPVGLSQALNAVCGALSGRKRLDLHVKTASPSMNGNIPPCRQTCLCALGREFGLQKELMDQFQKFLSVETFCLHHPIALQPIHDYHFEIPSIYADIYHDTSANSFQLFSSGNVELMLEFCGDYWNGKDLGVINENIERKISEFYQNAIISDMHVVAYGYRPLHLSAARRFLKQPNYRPISLNLPAGLEASYSRYVDLVSPQVSVVESPAPISLMSPVVANSPLPFRPGHRKHIKRKTQTRLLSRVDSASHLEDMTEIEFSKEAVRGQTMLGLASFIYPPKPNVVDVIEDLGLGGVRFVYFSSAPERESKSYAERLGLEIDWNSCIILSPDDGTGPGYLAIHDMKARLPRGIDNIRPHLQKVDDVPLHVSLFAESDPYTTREMIRIFQENGEIVCCLGSSLNDDNVECFAMSDISIGVDPISGMKHRAGLQGPVNPFTVAAGFNTAPCALTLNSDTSLYTVTQIIREARTLVENGRLAFGFYMGSQCAISAVWILSSCALLPPIFSGYDVIFLSWIAIPILASSLIFSPHRKTVMTEMVVKNVDHLKDKRRFAFYFIARFCIIPPVVCIVVFALLLMNVKTGSQSFDLINGFSTISWDKLDDDRMQSLQFAQTLSLLFFMYYMVIISASFVSRVENVIERPPWVNRPWLFAAPISMGAVVIFSALNLIGNQFSLSNVPYFIWIIGLSPILLLPPLQELVKLHDKQEWVRFQKRSKLEFNTKLGMHSPL